MTTTLDAAPVNVGAPPGDTRAGFARRSRIRRGVGVVLVGAAVLLGWHQDTLARRREPVLVVVRRVPAGERVTKDDIAVAHVALDGRIASMPGRDLRTAIGKVAKVDLVPRLLLVEDWLADEAGGEDTVRLPVPLKTGRFPPDLQVGDHVFVVVTASNEGTDAGNADATLAAVVVAVDGDRGSFGVGETVVTLSIPKAELSRLAAASGDGRVLLAASR
jgi:hypothetical protein